MSFNDRFNDVEIEYNQHNSEPPWAWVRVDVTVVRPVFEISNLPSTLKSELQNVSFIVGTYFEWIYWGFK